MTTETLAPAALPHFGRPDAGLIVTSEIVVPDAALARPLADTILDTFDRWGWPDGLLAHAVLLGTDGLSLQHYAQWSGTAAYDAFAANDSPARQDEVRSAAPGLERGPAGPYTRYRSAESQPGVIPGCLVVINVEFDGPDPQRQRDWVDAVFEAMACDARRPDGGLSAHFHLSLDGQRVINLAGWADEASHIAALAENEDRSIGSGPLWARVQNFPGTAGSRVRRFVPYRTRTAGDGGDANVHN